MRTKNPLKGLLMFSFYSASKNLSASLVICFLLAAGTLISNSAGLSAALFGMFLFVTMLNIPMGVIMSMAAKEGKWERFQLTMPARRKDMICMQYLSVALTTICSTCMVVIVIGIATVTHDYMFNYGFIHALVESIYLFGLPLLMTGMCFPLATSKFGQGREHVILTISMLVSVGIMIAMPQLGFRLDLSMEMLSVLILAVSVTIFVVSYPITKTMYAKTDF